jgi:RimJ/RimL family protein N-acetyltransferase
MLCYKLWNKFKFESSLNLKGSKPFGKNLINLLKFYPEEIFLNMNLVGHTCMQENEVSIQVSIYLGLKIKKEFKFKNQTNLYSL